MYNVRAGVRVCVRGSRLRDGGRVCALRGACVAGGDMMGTHVMAAGAACPGGPLSPPPPWSLRLIAACARCGYSALSYTGGVPMCACVRDFRLRLLRGFLHPCR